MKRGLYFAIGCGVILAGMGLLPHSAGTVMQSAAGNVFAPFASFWHGVREAFSRLSLDRDEIMAQNMDMRVELEEARHEVSRLKWLEEENRRMKNLLNMTPSAAHELVAARVTARDVSGWWRKVRLNVGSDDGVGTDMPVVNGAGLVGRTASVSSKRCDVLLMIDPSCRVSAHAAGSGAFGILRGQTVSARGDVLCRMEYIAQGVRIKPGDELVTSGLGGVFPPGLAVGRVKQVYADPSDLYQIADVVPRADFRSLDFVFVVRPGRGEKAVRALEEQE